MPNKNDKGSKQITMANQIEEILIILHHLVFGFERALFFLAQAI